jgi:hypothetical protein
LGLRGGQESGGDGIMRSGDHIKKKGMGGACGPYRAEDRRMKGFGRKI